MPIKTGFALVGESRAEGLKGRMALAAFIGTTAWVYAPSIWPAVWFVAMSLGQIADYYIFLPYRRDPTNPRSMLYRVFTCVFVFLNTVLYAGITLYIWRSGDETGRLFAVLQACGGLLHVTLYMHQQRALLFLALAAHTCYLLGLPMTMALSAGPLSLFVFVVGCLLYISHMAIEVANANRANQALKAATLAAEKANAAKTDFLATISHEIRTPMNAVMAAVQLLDRTDPTPEQAAHIKMMSQASEVLMGLLNDVLDLSRIEAGKMRLDPTDLDLRPALEALISLWQPQAAAKACQLVLSVAPDVPEILHVDSLRLRQILFNLLSNAVKFTDHGLIRLNVGPSAAPLLGDQPGLYFEVVDTGCGISEEVLGRLFGSFEQADAGTTRQHGGSGLGLAISRRLAENMGGGLTVQSRLGEGSTFRLDLPLRRGRAMGSLGREFRRTNRLTHPDPHGDLNSALALNILLAEDHDVNRHIIEQLLSPLNCDLTMVSDGIQAVAAASRVRFDLIMLDMQMPYMDGLAAARAIRDQPGPNRLSPILAITANALEQHRAEWARLGVEAYITKPLNADLLIKTVLALAGQRSPPRTADVRKAS
jgi:signal transduction histidine kinase/AmiR/NasT family two-component response regulator